MTSSADERWMDRAIQLAKQGRTAPNPQVGAVIVRDGVLVSEGFHRRAGADHAEVDALKDAEGLPIDATGATLYVTLEPCNHHGRTPPCTDAVVEAGIARVVIATVDPTEHTKGSLDKLRAAGIEVLLGVRREQADELVADFAVLATQGRPFVTLKAAITLDGRMATRSGDSKWITGEAARADGHRLRATHDAVLVGIETVLADDPQLNVRMAEGPDPIRVVLDTTLRTPPDARTVIGEGGPTWILHGPGADAQRSEALIRAGVTLISVPRSERGLNLHAALASLGQRDIMRLMVEGGATVHGALVDEGLAEACVLYLAPRILGDASAPGFAAGREVLQMKDAKQLMNMRTHTLGDDVRVEARFAPAPNERQR